MNLVIKVIGVVFVLIAIGYFLKPDILKSLMEFFKKGRRIYLAALARFVLGIVFLLGARECDMPVVIGILGVVFLVAGLLIILLGPEKVNGIIDWYQKQSKFFFRTLALVLFALGIAIIYAA